jgi:pantetheine-phosphate adenylyltransferase
VFLMASERHQFISSRFVKEIGRLGGDIGGFVSPRVAGHLMRRFADERRRKGESKRRIQTFED